MKGAHKPVLALAVLVGLASWMEIVSTRVGTMRPARQEQGAAVRRSPDAPLMARESLRSPVTTPAARQNYTASYYRLPLSFEANKGQTDPRMKFLSRGLGYSLFLEPNQATLVFHRRLHEDSAATLRPVEFNRLLPRPVEASALRLRLVGANANAAMSGLEEQPGRSNYFLGNDPKKWRTNVAQYGKVHMAQVYPGIDLVFYGNQQQLEYDFNVAPGADPNAIRLRVDGARHVRLAANGDVQIESGADEIRLRRPFLYQIVSGEKRPVEGGFRVSGNREISFATGAYDRTLPLIIDPVLAYSEIIDSGGGAEIVDVAVDANGNAYVTGNTCGPDYPTTPGPFTTQHFPFEILCEDAVVTKLDPTASSLVYSDIIGGSKRDSGTRLALDGQGNVYLTGITSSKDFPTTPNAIIPSSSFPQGNCVIVNFSPVSPCFDAFALKLSADGSSLLYSTLLGGSQETFGLYVDVNGNGEAHVLGITNSSDFVPKPNGLQTVFGGGTCTVLGGSTTRPCFDVFLVKLSADGGSALYSTFLGGNDDDYAGGMALDGLGNAYLAGATDSANFPKTATVPPSGGALANPMAAYAAKINPGANPPSSGLVYAILLQGDQLQGADTIAIDGSGNAYITGATSSPHFPTVNALQSTYLAGSNTNCQDQQASAITPPQCGNAFVAEVNPAGTALLFSTFLGGTGPDAGAGIVLDALTNSLWVTGTTASANFPTTPDAYHTLASGQNGAFLINLSGDGSKILFSTLLSAGGGSTAGVGMVVDGHSNVYVAGIDSDLPPGFPVTSGVYPFNTAVSPASFLVKFSPGPAPAIQFSPNSLTFLDAALGSTSAPKTIMVQNTGAGAMQISMQMGMTVDGHLTALSTPNFFESDNCGTTLAAAAQCTVQVTFEPTPNPPPPFPGVPPSNARSATLTILDNAPGGPHTVALSGKTGNSPTFVVQQNPIVFAPQKAGTTSQPFNGAGANNGDVVANITNVALGGPNASDFSYTPDSFHPCTQVIAGVFCSFQLTFHPPANATGTRTATLTFTDNAPDSPQVVDITGTVDTNFNVSPTSIFLGPTAINASPAISSTIVTLDNPTSGSVQVTGLMLGGTNGSDFTINTSNCSPNPPPFTVAAGTSCTVGITFDPTSGSGGLRTGTLTITSPQITSSLVVALNGAAVSNTDPFLSLFVVPNPMNFGGILLGQRTPVTNALINISNQAPIPCGSGASTCGGPLNITSMAAGNGDFTIAPASGSGSSCTVAPVTIPTGSGCTYSVTFGPSAAGDRSTVITIQSNDPRGAMTIPLIGSGLALPIAQVSPTVLNFGKSAIGTASVAQTVTLTNTGRANLTVTSITPPANYAVATNGCTQPVPPNGSCSFTVTFTPPAAGNFLGTLIIADNGAFGGQQAVGLSGSGGTGASLTVSPLFVNFGNQVLNSFSAPQTITLTSSGDTAVNIATNGLRTTGDFPILSTTCGSSLAPKATCTAQIEFHPSTSFFETGSLLAATSAPGSPQAAYFQGFGVSAGPASTTTGLQSSLNPATAGQAVTFTAGVTSTTAGTLTGTVTFFDGATQLGTSAVNNGQAQFATSSLAAGTHTITAVYSGDTNFHGSTSPAVQQVITSSGQSATTTTVASSVNPSTFGQSVMFTATVTSAAAGTPTGTATFKDGATTLGTGTLDNTGKASFSTSSLAAGAHSITAAYGGDSNFAASTSAALTQTVKAASSTAVGSSANPSTVGQSVTFTATVTSATAGTPTGTVTFMDGATTIGNGTLDNTGKASFSTSSLAAGAHSITASYGGDATFAASTSPALTQTVNGPDFSVSANPQSATINAGQPAAFTLSVMPINGSTQTVTVSCTGAPHGATCTPANGSVMLDGVHTAMVQVNITTMARSAGPKMPGFRQFSFWRRDPGWLQLAVELVLAMSLLVARRRRRRFSALVFMVLVLAVFAGCNGGGGANGTPAGTYTLTATGATSGGSTHSAPFTLTVH